MSRHDPLASRTDDLITGIDGAGAPYPIEKLEAHRRSTRHLAISVFLFDGTGRLLLQQRAEGKYHSGGLWANSCCSHPRWTETPPDCARRRLPEELGVSARLEEFAVVEYAAPVGALFENELVHCFRGRLGASADLTRFDPAEVQAVRWIGLSELAAELRERPDLFVPWLRIYMERHEDPQAAFLISA